MLKCKMCGACCRTVALDRSREDLEVALTKIIENFRADKKMDWQDYDIYFAYLHLVEISREEAEKINPKIKLWRAGLHFYKCNMLDKSGRCKDYENRPRFCRMYPLPQDSDIPLYSDDCGFKELECKIDSVTGKYSRDNVKPKVSLIIR